MPSISCLLFSSHLWTCALDGGESDSLLDDISARSSLRELVQCQSPDEIAIMIFWSRCKFESPLPLRISPWLTGMKSEASETAAAPAGFAKGNTAVGQRGMRAALKAVGRPAQCSQGM